MLFCGVDLEKIEAHEKVIKVSLLQNLSLFNLRCEEIFPDLGDGVGV
jgi:hypothetical protein